MSVPLEFVCKKLAESEHDYQQACKQVKHGMLGNAQQFREIRDIWWQEYRAAKRAAIALSVERS